MAGPIRIAILANGSQAKREFNSVGSTASGIGSKFRSAAVPATALLAGIAAGAKGAVTGASDLNEEASKSKVIFGDGAAAIDKFASTADTRLGQSKTQALNAASTFGIIGQSAGLSGGEVTKFATKFTGLSSDLASFNNTTPEEAITAIGAAMRGESEPIRKYGVLLDDATLRNRALKLGLIDSVKSALTPQQKALAASQEILAQTGKAQGDFARTSDGVANKGRIAAAQVDNLKAGLGQGLLPAYSAALSVGSKFVTFLTKYPAVAKIGIVVLGALAVAILAVNAAMLLNPAVLVVAGIVALGAALVLAYQKCEPFRTVVQQLAAVFVTNVLPVLKQVGAFIVGTLVPMFLRTAQAVGKSLKPVLTQLAATFQTRILPVVKQAAAKFREWWPTIQRVVTVVAKLFLGLIRFQAAVVGKVLPVIIRLAGFLISKVIPAVLAFVGGVIKIIGKLISFGAALVRAVNAVGKFAAAVGRKVADVVKWFVELPGRILDALGDLGTLLYDAGAKIISGLVDGIKSKIGDVAGELASLTSKIPDLKGPPKRDATLLRANGRLIIGGLINGFRDRRGDVAKSLRDYTTEISRTTIDGTPRVRIGRGGLPALPAVRTLKVARVQTRAVDRPALDTDATHTRRGGSGDRHYTIRVEVTPLSNPAQVGRAVVEAVEAFEAAGGRGLPR